MDNVDYRDIKVTLINDATSKTKIAQLISNPIHIYNVIKEILRFTEKIYPLLSETATHSGVSFVSF